MPTVYPTKRSACLIVHPISGPLKQSGSDWIMDGFTSRMLAKELTTEDFTKSYQGAPPTVRVKVRPAPRAAANRVAGGRRR